MKNKNFKKLINQSIEDHLHSFDYVYTDDFHNNYLSALYMVYKTIKNKGCIFTCGNGGSFSDAQHFTAELIVRYYRERGPLSSITLGSNFSNITACANDYSYEEIFKREYAALSSKEDTLIAISTSGRSKNILNIINYASNQGKDWILLTSDKAKELPSNGTVISFPSSKTSAIQECHIFTLQLICKGLDHLIFDNQ